MEGEAMKDTELLLYTTEQGGEWHIVHAHSVVVDGMRWDVKSRAWAQHIEPVINVWPKRDRATQG